MGAIDLDAPRLAGAIRDAIRRAALDRADPAEFAYVNLKAIAQAAGLEQRALVAAARAGRFAPVLRLTERTILVRVSDLRAWEARVEISPRRAAAVAGYLDDSPAEPFATPVEMTAAAPRDARSSGRRTAEVGRDLSMRRRARQPRGGARD